MKDAAATLTKSVFHEDKKRKIIIYLTDSIQ